jgi:hypothetical protein
VADFILLCVEGVLAFVEHLFHHGVPSRRGKVRKSLDGRKARASKS